MSDYTTISFEPDVTPIRELTLTRAEWRVVRRALSQVLRDLDARLAPGGDYGRTRRYGTDGTDRAWPGWRVLEEHAHPDGGREDLVLPDPTAKMMRDLYACHVHELFCRLPQTAARGLRGAAYGVRDESDDEDVTIRLSPVEATVIKNAVQSARGIAEQSAQEMARREAEGEEVTPMPSERAAKDFAALMARLMDYSPRYTISETEHPWSAE